MIIVMLEHGHLSAMLVITTKTGVICNFLFLQLMHMKCLAYAEYSVTGEDTGETWIHPSQLSCTSEGDMQAGWGHKSKT